MINKISLPRIAIVCYRNQRSAGIAEVIRQETRTCGLEFDIRDGGIPEWTKPGMDFNPSYVEAFHVLYPSAAEVLVNRTRKPTSPEDLSDGSILTVDGFIADYLVKNLGVKEFRTKRVLDSMGLPVKDMDDPEVCIARKQAQYIEKRKISPDERFDFIALNGARYEEGSRAGYYALVNDCIAAGQSIAKVMKNLGSL